MKQFQNDYSEFKIARNFSVSIIHIMISLKDSGMGNLNISKGTVNAE